MRMLRIFLVAFLGVFFSNINASGITPEQKRFRDNISQFLKEEGFVPTVDEEYETLDFKREGINYWISISESNPLYVEIHRTILSFDNDELFIVLEAANYANNKAAVAKAIVKDDYISFVIEMFCHSVEEFKYVFYKSMSELSSIKDYVQDYYDKHK